MEIKGYDFDETFRYVCNVLNKCSVHSPRGLKTKGENRYLVQSPQYIGEY